jgi:hypothetical protein
MTGTQTTPKLESVYSAAFEEFSSLLPKEVRQELSIQLGSDGLGSFLNFSCPEKESAAALRVAIPHSFMGYRTIVSYYSSGV